MADGDRRVLDGVPGASGVVYGIRALELLAAMPEVETHLMLTAPARTTIGIEADRTVAEVEALAADVHPLRDIAAGPASGSFRSKGMLVAP